MSFHFVARIVFVLAMALTLSAPLAGPVSACDPGTGPGLC
ncbi:MAG: hypothetical protein QOH08_1805 [Chloroflexota bacterium]|nr:hypothetical protein [Chloroflexota bacterium]